MNRTKTALCFTAALLTAFLSNAAVARGHFVHSRVGVSISVGVPFYGFGYYAPYYRPAYYPAYYPAPVIVQQATQTYVEQSRNEVPVSPAPRASDVSAQAWWYYCADSKAYYPYVKSCQTGWQPVSPVPPAGSGG